MPDTLTTCNPWTQAARPSDAWTVVPSGVSLRRITEAVALRRTEQGDIRIVLRGAFDPWTLLPDDPTTWFAVGHDVRLTEDGCTRITEDGNFRIVE